MCGICGVIQVGGEPRPVLAAEALDRMTDAMSHRGPDDRGTYMTDGVALGARRLSVVDVAGGHQPFRNEDGSVWAVQNGELYNHVELRERLMAEGHRMASRCDTEILPHLYERHGTRAFRELRGMFGIAIWDGSVRRGVLARDRLGIKPLYHARVGDLLVFGSELKSVLASGLVEPQLDYEAIDAYLTLGIIPGPRTPIAGVSKLLPGHLLVVEGDGVTIERFWEYPRPDPIAGMSLDDAADGLLEQLDESVRLRLMADVPLGAMLSGGLDSSLIVAMMARHSSAPVQTFSVGFREAGEANELADARLVASALGADHHELELSVADEGVDLAELVWSMDEPLADLSGLGFLALSELASRHVTVALSGQGADELLGGYMKHQAASLCAAWARMPAPLRRAEARVAPLARGRLRRAARTLAATDPADRLMAMSSKLDRDLRRLLVTGPMAALDGDPARDAVRAILAGLDGDALSTTLYVDGQLALVDDMLHYFDRASMYYSLEVRVPFLDHHLVEYCARIPPRHKVHRLKTKRVLRHAARGLVPDRAIDKKKVGFFRPAVDRWFRTQTEGPVHEYLLAPDPHYAAFLDRGVVAELVRMHQTRSGRPQPHLLLAILMLEVWLVTYLPRAVATYTPPRETIRLGG
jgi:asparagine synthase (glutamine-hydrolysing)